MPRTGLIYEVVARVRGERRETTGSLSEVLRYAKEQLQAGGEIKKIKAVAGA